MLKSSCKNKRKSNDCITTSTVATKRRNKGQKRRNREPNRTSNTISMARSKSDEDSGLGGEKSMDTADSNLFPESLILPLKTEGVAGGIKTTDHPNKSCDTNVENVKSCSFLNVQANTQSCNKSLVNAQSKYNQISTDTEIIVPTKLNTFCTKKFSKDLRPSTPTSNYNLSKTNSGKISSPIQDCNTSGTKISFLRNYLPPEKLIKSESIKISVEDFNRNLISQTSMLEEACNRNTLYKADVGESTSFPQMSNFNCLKSSLSSMNFNEHLKLKNKMANKCVKRLRLDHMTEEANELPDVVSTSPKILSFKNVPGLITPNIENSEQEILKLPIFVPPACIPDVMKVTQAKVTKSLKKKLRNHVLDGTFPSISSDGRIELQLLKQPESQHRARYQTEGSRGAVKDMSGTGHPTVKLRGSSEPAILQVFVGSDSGVVSPHLFYQVCKVSGKNSTQCCDEILDSVHLINIPMKPENDMVVSCDCVGILKERNVDVEHRMKAFVSRAKKSSKCRLIFRTQVTLPTGEKETLQIVSQPISCTQPPGVPEISQASKTRCSVTGLKKLFIIGKNFCKDTKIVFKEVSGDSKDDEIWSYEVYPEKDYLQSTHLICEIPPYYDQEVKSAVTVQIIVVSSGKNSDPQPFTYVPIVKENCKELEQQRVTQQLPKGVSPDALKLNELYAQSEDLNMVHKSKNGHDFITDFTKSKTNRYEDEIQLNKEKFSYKQTTNANSGKQISQISFPSAPAVAPNQNFQKSITTTTATILKPKTTSQFTASKVDAPKEDSKLENLIQILRLLKNIQGTAKTSVIDLVVQEIKNHFKQTNVNQEKNSTTETNLKSYESNASIMDTTTSIENIQNSVPEAEVPNKKLPHLDTKSPKFENNVKSTLETEPTLSLKIPNFINANKDLLTQETKKNGISTSPSYIIVNDINCKTPSILLNLKPTATFTNKNSSLGFQNAFTFENTPIQNSHQTDKELQNNSMTQSAIFTIEKTPIQNLHHAVTKAQNDTINTIKNTTVQNLHQAVTETQNNTMNTTFPFEKTPVQNLHQAIKETQNNSINIPFSFDKTPIKTWNQVVTETQYTPNNQNIVYAFEKTPVQNLHHAITVQSNTINATFPSEKTVYNSQQAVTETQNTTFTFENTPVQNFPQTASEMPNNSLNTTLAFEKAPAKSWHTIVTEPQYNSNNQNTVYTFEKTPIQNLQQTITEAQNNSMNTFSLVKTPVQNFEKAPAKNWHTIVTEPQYNSNNQNTVFTFVKTPIQNLPQAVTETQNNSINPFSLVTTPVQNFERTPVKTWHQDVTEPQYNSNNQNTAFTFVKTPIQNLQQTVTETQNTSMNTFSLVKTPVQNFHQAVTETQYRSNDENTAFAIEKTPIQNLHVADRESQNNSMNATFPFEKTPEVTYASKNQNSNFDFENTAVKNMHETDTEMQNNQINFENSNSHNFMNSSIVNRTTANSNSSSNNIKNDHHFNENAQNNYAPSSVNNPKISTEQDTNLTEKIQVNIFSTNSNCADKASYNEPQTAHHTNNDDRKQIFSNFNESNRTLYVDGTRVSEEMFSSNTNSDRHTNNSYENLNQKTFVSSNFNETSLNNTNSDTVYLKTYTDPNLNIVNYDGKSFDSQISFDDKSVRASYMNDKNQNTLFSSDTSQNYENDTASSTQPISTNYNYVSQSYVENNVPTTLQNKLPYNADRTVPYAMEITTQASNIVSAQPYLTNQKLSENESLNTEEVKFRIENTNSNASMPTKIENSMYLPNSTEEYHTISHSPVNAATCQMQPRVSIETERTSDDNQIRAATTCDPLLSQSTVHAQPNNTLQNNKTNEIPLLSNSTATTSSEVVISQLSENELINYINPNCFDNV